MRFSLLALAVTLSACKTGVAPVTDDYQLEDAYGSRSTALGIRTTYEGDEGTTDFGAAAALTGDHLVVSEKADGTVCGSRLKVIGLAGDGSFDQTVECVSPNPRFGTFVEGRDSEFASGLDGFYVQSNPAIHDGTMLADDTYEGDGFGDGVVLLDSYRAAVSAPQHGISGAVYIFEHDVNFQFVQVAKITHPDVMDFGGFGTHIFGDQGRLVVEDSFGRQFLFEETGGDWRPIEAPAGKILAMNGDTVLVAPPTGADLTFYDYREGAWEAAGVLLDAKLPYTEWAFDEVAAFAVQPGAGAFRGFIDRYTRIDGELDATVRLTLDHTGLDLDLDGTHLMVAEAVTAGGAVHVFDWADDRAEMQAAYFCPGGDDAFEPNDSTADATVATEGTFVVGNDSDDYFFLGSIEAGQTVSASIGWATEQDIDLYLVDANGENLATSLTFSNPEDVSWTNHGEATDVYVRVKMYTADAPCTEYTLTSLVEDAEPLPTCDYNVNVGNDTYETASLYEDLDAALDPGSPVDFYDFSGVFANERVIVDLAFSHEQGDLDICLEDAEGTTVACSQGVSDTEQIVYDNLTEETLEVRLRVFWFGAPEVGECVPYQIRWTFEDATEPTPATSDLVISEIMANPAEASDAAGEWFELYNSTDADIDLDGYEITDNNNNSHVITGSVIVPAGGYAVLGRNADLTINGNVPVDYAYGSAFSLVNSADTIEIRDAFGTTIDALSYDSATWPLAAGTSMSLGDLASDNADPANWCTATSPIGTDFGTPGFDNDAC